MDLLAKCCLMLLKSLIQPDRRGVVYCRMHHKTNVSPQGTTGGRMGHEYTHPHLRHRT